MITRVAWGQSTVPARITTLACAPCTDGTVPHGVAVVEVGTSFSDELARAGVGELAALPRGRAATSEQQG